MIYIEFTIYDSTVEEAKPRAQMIARRFYGDLPFRLDLIGEPLPGGHQLVDLYKITVTAWLETEE